MHNVGKTQYRNYKNNKTCSAILIAMLLGLYIFVIIQIWKVCFFRLFVLWISNISDIIINALMFWFPTLSPFPYVSPKYFLAHVSIIAIITTISLKSCLFLLDDELLQSRNFGLSIRIVWTSITVKNQALNIITDS